MKRLFPALFLFLACGNPTGPEVYYWIVCESPGVGWVQDGPFDSYREAYEAGQDEEKMWRELFGIYMDCDVRTQSR